MPALNDVLAASQTQGVRLQQVVAALTGTPSGAIPIALTALNDPINYALTVQNDEPTNSRALKVLKADGTHLIVADATGVTLGSPLNLVAGSIGGGALAPGSVNSATIADGTIQNVDLAAGVAAANVGALGGVLGGTLPNPTMAAGAAATNVGALGGVLTGTLPSPGLATGSVTTTQILDGTIGTADLAAGAITQVPQATAVTTESTTSSSFASMVAPIVNFTASGGICVAWFTGVFYNTAAGGTADCQFSIRLDSGSFPGLGRFYNPGASWRVTVSMVLSLGALSGVHNVSIGWLTGAGTLSSDTTQRTLTVIEFKR